MSEKKAINFFKEWIYPILVPIIVAWITISILTPSSPILDISTEDYYQVNPSIEGTLPILIRNTNDYEVDIYTIGYIFSWDDHNPKGVNYTTIKPATINSENNNETTFRESSVITLSPAGLEGNSILKEPKIKTPSEGSHVLTVKINTNKGEITKDIQIIVVEN